MISNVCRGGGSQRPSLPQRLTLWAAGATNATAGARARARRRKRIIFQLEGVVGWRGKVVAVGVRRCVGLDDAHKPRESDANAPRK